MGDFLHLKALLHSISQGFLYPTIIVLILLILFVIVILAGVICEAVQERRYFKVKLPEFLAKLESVSYEELPEVIEKSGLLRTQRNSLHTLVAYSYLPEDTRIALAKESLAHREAGYLRITSRTDTAAKISPMIGLMGTLIPLGPGIAALGEGQTDLLAGSIEVAFDTTILGLVIAAVCLLISRFRKAWYEEYLNAEEAAMTTLLEKARLALAENQNLGDAETAQAYLDKYVVEEKRGLFKRVSQGKQKTPKSEVLPPVEAGE